LEVARYCTIERCSSDVPAEEEDALNACDGSAVQVQHAEFPTVCH